MVNHTVSTNFVIVIAHLSLYSVILNHPITGLTIVTDLRFKFYFFPLLGITYGTIIPAHSLFHGISSAILLSQLLTQFWTSFINPCQYKF